MTLGEVILTAPHSPGATFFNVSGLVNALATLGFVPNQMTVYQTRGSLWGTYAITGAAGAFITGCSLIAGTDANFVPGDVLLLQLAPSPSNEIIVVPDAATITFNLALGSVFQTTLGGNRTLAVENAQGQQKFEVIFIQDATGSRVPTWFNTIWWANETEGVLTTTAGGIDYCVFKVYTPTIFLGTIAMPNVGPA